MIEIRNVSRSFKNRIAVDSLSFSVESGEILALVGPNGAGKTTTVRLLCGLLNPDRGEIYLAGEKMSTDAHHLRKKLGLLPSSHGFYDSLSVELNLRFYGELQNIPATRLNGRIGEFLEKFELVSRRYEPVGSLSKGTQQKLAIVRAMLHDPKILFLDEPLSGLDPESARTVKDMLMSLKKEKYTILLTTHNLDMVEELANRIAVLNTRLYELTTPDELRKKLLGATIKLETDRVDERLLELIRKIPNVAGVENRETSLLVRTEIKDPKYSLPCGTERETRALIAKKIIEEGYKLYSLEEMTGSLEEAYLKLMAKLRKENQNSEDKGINKSMARPGDSQKIQEPEFPEKPSEEIPEHTVSGSALTGKAGTEEFNRAENRTGTSRNLLEKMVRILAVLKKDLGELLRNRMVLASLVVTSLIFAIMPLFTVSQIKNITPSEVTRFLSYFPGFSPDQIMMEIMVKHWKILFLMIPGLLPIIIAAHSFGSERKSHALEVLFSTPASDFEILAAKMLAAFIPSEIATLFSFIILSTGLNYYYSEKNFFAGTNAFRDSEWFIIVFLLGPLLGLFSISLTIFLSSRISDTRAVQQIGSFIVMPLLLIAIGQVYGLVMLSPYLLMFSSLIIATVDFLMLFLVSKIFNREKVLTSW